MMIGTILSNFWVALLTFSIYFFLSFPFVGGLEIILDAGLVALVAFLLTFLARAIIAYVISNPPAEIVEVTLEHKGEILKSEISQEDYAELVKTMLKEDEHPNSA